MSEFDPCCGNCKHFHLEDIFAEVPEQSRIANKVVVKKVKVADGACRRFPKPEARNKVGYCCGEFSFVTPKRNTNAR